MIQVTGYWQGESRPVETDFTVSQGGTLRIRHRERWIECNAREFLLAALAGVLRPAPPRGDMQKWALAVKDLLPDNSVVDITSCETAGDMALVGVENNIISLEMLISADCKQVCKAVAKGLWDTRQEKELVQAIRSAWWD